MPNRVNRAIDLLAQDQPIYNVNCDHVLTYEQGRKDAQTWADYISVGMEHEAFDLAGLAEYMRGLGDGGPTSLGHRTPAVIVEAPVRGTDELNVRFNDWQFRQILARGVHGILLCQVESPEAVRAFVESCRYRHHLLGVDPALRAPGRPARETAGEDKGLARSTVSTNARPLLGLGTRGRASEKTAAPVWGLTTLDYIERCEPWPLNPRGELLLGIKLESPEAVARCEEILQVPGIGFAQIGVDDLSLCFGYLEVRRDAYPPELEEARQRVLAACKKYGLPFSENATPANVIDKIEEGARMIRGRQEETAVVGRGHAARTRPS